MTDNSGLMPRTARLKQRIVAVARGARLLRPAEALKYLWECYRVRRKNAFFVAQHPGFTPPPPDVAFDAYANTDWTAYDATGREHAGVVAGLIERHAKDFPTRICEWGCGPARVLRHLRECLGARSVELFGFDYNARSNDWCRENIANVAFRTNLLAPPLPCEADAFDCLYAISVLTHLSREMRFRWIAELSRVVRPDGLIIVTTHGDACRNQLLPHERRQYDRGEMVVRGNFDEGRRLYVAYQPPSFMRANLLRDLRILSHGLLGVQDVWIVRNTKWERV